MYYVYIYIYIYIIKIHKIHNTYTYIYKVTLYDKLNE